MGHRDTSEEQGRECAVCSFDGGPAAAVGGSVEGMVGVGSVGGVARRIDGGSGPGHTGRVPGVPARLVAASGEARVGMAVWRNGIGYGWRVRLGTRAQPRVTVLPERHSAHLPIRVRLAFFGLRFYKAYLSMLVGGSCRFEPTCSVYAYEAIERFGLARGSRLAVKRLARCHPFSGKFGHDPVPEIWDDTVFAGRLPQTADSATIHYEVHR
jgi:uncharacterized protein